MVSGVEMTQANVTKVMNIPMPKLDFKAVELSEEGCQGYVKSFGRYREHLENAGLRQSLKAFNRFMSKLERPPVLLSELADSVEDIHQRIADELEDLELWQVTSEHLKYLATDPLKLEGKFPPVYRDAEEAGKCLAYDRGTACVFHLMRIMECGLRALGASLGDPRLDPKRNPSWDSILKKCDEELVRPLQNRCDEGRQDDAFYSTATANLRAVKDAWRNPTLHIERDYMPEDAQDVWNAVGGFMRHLSKRLSASI
jgi:hypothetical protein